MPLKWAATQNNLGSALQTLGARESGTATLTKAVEAYLEALKERTRERVPLDWAMTQNNLGTVLRAISARESGTEVAERKRPTLFDEALSVCRQGVFAPPLGGKRNEISTQRLKTLALLAERTAQADELIRQVTLRFSIRLARSCHGRA